MTNENPYGTPDPQAGVPADGQAADNPVTDAPDTGGTADGPGTEAWTISAPQTIEVPDLRSLSVQLTSGSLDVVADPSRERGATVEVRSISDRPLDVTTRGGELRVAYEFSGIEGLVDRVRGLKDKDSAEVRVVVPATVDVKATTVGARVIVTGTRSPVSVTTVTGTVRSAGTTGVLAVKTVAGAVDVTEHTGDARLATTSGAVAIGGDLGRVTVSTVSGGVAVTSPSSTPLVNAKTVSGDVAVRLGAGTGVNLRVRSVSGKVALDGATLDSSAQRTTSVDHVDHGYGTPGAYVSATTVSGDVVVSRG